MRELDVLPTDRGPIYIETDLSRFPVEPWNTASNLVFLLVIIYWIRKTRFDAKRYPFLVFCLPILIVGFIGGTVYHATRSSPVWLVMDFAPIGILGGLSCWFLWLDVFKNRVYALGAVLIPMDLIRRFRMAMPFSHSTNCTIGYLLFASVVLAPAIVHCRLNQWKHGRELALAGLSFAAAVFCRELEQHLTLLPMGTHFLWHVLGGISAFFLMSYISHYDYRDASEEASTREVSA